MLAAMKSGVSRPGEMRRALPGLRQKVQTDCLRKMENAGLLTRTSFHEVPPRVEYTLTATGEEFASLLATMDDLQSRIDQNARL